MIVYRFAKAEFAEDLSGTGAKLFGGRWNSKGVPVVYLSFTTSLALLELLIHSINYQDLVNNKLVAVEFPDDNISHLEEKKLKRGWQNDIEYTKGIGDDFVYTSSSLLLKVPSVIIPFEYNVILNPKHIFSSKLKIRNVLNFKFDTWFYKLAD